MRARSTAILLVLAILGFGISLAFAGEVQGPPGTPGVAGSGSGVRTKAPAHASSICAYNGLNDMTVGQGPIDSIVQTPHNQGVPGESGADAQGSGTPGAPTCGRDSNPEPH